MDLHLRIYFAWAAEVPVVTDTDILRMPINKPVVEAEVDILLLFLILAWQLDKY